MQGGCAGLPGCLRRGAAVSSNLRGAGPSGASLRHVSLSIPIHTPKVSFATMIRSLPHRLAPPSPVLLLALLLLPLAAFTACGGASEPAVEPLPAGSNILLITVDTLRADHLSSYGYRRETSPVMDRLAAQGVRFERPSVQWPKTGPSMASMFTATYPKDNGIVRRIGMPLPCRFEMLAESLKKQGYDTHAVVANGALASDFYFDQGFDTYIETWKLDADDHDPNTAGPVTDLAVGLLGRLKEAEAAGRPWFLWVHYLDPHAPYTPPGEWSERFQGDEHWSPEPKINISDRPRQQMYGIGREQVLDGRDELAFYVARYDAEIAYSDAQIGELLEAMEERDLMGRTLTVLTSDHGESLGEHHYYFDHGRFSFQTCLKVPLIFHYPGVLEPRVDAEPVELIHLTPTLLEAAGVELPGGRWMQGRTLTPRLRGVTEERRGGGGGPEDGPEGGSATGPTPGYAFAEAGWETHNRWQKVVQDGRFKLIYAQSPPEQRWIAGEGVRFALFDLLEDPGETVNVAGEHPQELERLQRVLWRWENADPFPVEVGDLTESCGEEREMEGETRELLKSLGYL